MAEIVGSIENRDEVLASADDEDESARVDSGPVIEPLASEPADVVTFNTDQEFRRVKPRRNVRVPARYL